MNASYRGGMSRVVQAALCAFLLISILVAGDSRAQSSDDRVRFAVGLGLTLFNHADFSSLWYHDPGLDLHGEASLTFKQALALSFEARRTPAHAWGILGGLHFESERKLHRGSIILGPFVAPLDVGDEKVQVSTLYVSAVYRWQTFYLPFGLNISSVKYTPSSGFTGTYDATGTVGGQLGAGWLLSDHFAFEIYSWVTGIDLQLSEGNSTVDYGNGTFANFFVNGKYLF